MKAFFILAALILSIAGFILSVTDLWAESPQKAIALLSFCGVFVFAATELRFAIVYRLVIWLGQYIEDCITSFYIARYRRTRYLSFRNRVKAGRVKDFESEASDVID